jgi:uncharacterized membrane protein
MEQFIWFLGRFHVLVLHLPLGILTLAAVFEILVRFKPFKSFEAGLAPLWAAGALSAIATVVLGFMHASEESFQDMPAVEAHRWAGVALCGVACLVAVFRTRLWLVNQKFRIASVAIILFLMVLTGHLGGNLTHGDAYLLQYAPGPVRVLAGLPANAGPRPRPKDLASADIYLDVVQPALEQRCSNCHNNSRKSGGLSVASYETLMKGGSRGPVIKPGDPAASDLFRRVSLAPGAKDFMPKEGKTPLNGNEVAAIGWWIEHGAPASATVGSLQPTAKIAGTLQSIIGAQGAGDAGQVVAADSTSAGLPTVKQADENAVAKVIAEGFVVRNVYQGSNLLDVDYTSPNPVTPEVLADLARLAPNILRLNLRRSGITDADIKTIARFENLRQLRVEQNEITDAGATDIATLPHLTSLNLTNTRITDKGFEAVAALPGLKTLYVWGTPVTRAAVEKVKAGNKALHIEAGLRAEDVPPAGKVVPPDA